MKHLAKQWFLIGIVAAVMLAFWLPNVGEFIRRWNVLKGGIFVAFLITGLTLQTRQIVTELRNFKALIAAMIACLVIFPAVSFLLAKLFWPDNADMIVGACILGVAPATVASGTILTRVAKGNVPLSIFVCVASSLIAIFTIPLSLKLLLQNGQSIKLPVWQMVASLLTFVLLPTLIGQVMRLRLAEIITPCKRYFSLFSKLIVLLIIFNAVSKSASGILAVGAGMVMVFAFAVVVHVLMLGGNFGLARLLRLDRPSTSAFTIHCSQKTLTVSYLVWKGFFATLYPAALVPVIAHHISQMLLDTLVAERFGSRSEKQA